MTGLFPAGEERHATFPDGQVVFSNVNEGVPLSVRTLCASADGILRFAGSTSGVTIADQRKLVSHARAAFPADTLKNVILMSGGTRVLDEVNQPVMTVLEVPSVIRAVNLTCRTMGSTPRTTETAALTGTHTILIPRSHTTLVLPNPTLDLLWFIQDPAGQTDEWGLDVPLYFALFDHMRERKAATGLWVWGGGTVTAQEITTALMHGHPCAIVRGSGRMADAIINWVNGNFGTINDTYGKLIEDMVRAGCNPKNISVITSPQDTRRWLHANGFAK